MKKIVLTLLVLALATVSIQAQIPQRKIRNQHRGQHPNAQEKLDISAEQKNKFKSLNEDYRKKMMELKKEDDITVKEWKSRMADLQKKSLADQQNIFTPDQKIRMEKMKQERKQMAEIDTRARMEKMKLQLGLSTEQTEKFYRQQKEMQEQMKAFRENKSMDMLQKKEAYKELIEKRKDSMNSIFTEEQKKKMKEMKMRHPQRRGKLS
jgi:hypothetical protein